MDFILRRKFAPIILVNKSITSCRISATFIKINTATLIFNFLNHPQSKILFFRLHKPFGYQKVHPFSHRFYIAGSAGFFHITTNGLRTG
ncbi:MAG: hypothetical protein A2931_03350 [Candidatus Niyogibacteria bacterium RIFCSPLOWO2_01_FULL_45_48]|uniref:Uncharacterized protein n=1 Tax=Candidatus Niyogibacteria bacterium RIFCSPLOWO2_01_FULL_45_48 TaxID=1801724 RepID=A0A1G2EV64_9BACT|nr:MAG: hypothetical protein A2931_03350 [Candidatus Niyogibacteria bacterium RIFCSPLOWO2_01_FULL_45_48]